MTTSTPRSAQLGRPGQGNDVIVPTAMYPICSTCGKPFDGHTDHPYTASDDEMRRYVLAWIGHGWPGDEIRDAPSLEEAERAIHDSLGVRGAGGFGPHAPRITCSPRGVTYNREIDAPEQRMTWREVVTAIRSGGTQARLW